MGLYLYFCGFSISFFYTSLTCNGCEEYYRGKGMSNKGSHCAAWIRGFFISSMLLLSSCSDKENNATTQEAILSPSQINTPSEPQTNTSKNNIPISKRPPFSQLILKKISIDYPYTPDASFTSYINKLRARIDNKNMRTMQGELSPHFICLGSACADGLPIAQQFESLVTGLGDRYWDSLLTMVKTKYYQQVNGHICGPARANFIGQSKIKLEDHKVWFKIKIYSNECAFLVVETRENHKVIAYIRYDKEDDGWFVSVNLNDGFHGMGLGTRIIKESSDKVPGNITALVKEANVSSIKSFKKAGYIKTGSVLIGSENFHKLEYNRSHG